jgi:hypothetical protein
MKKSVFGMNPKKKIKFKRSQKRAINSKFERATPIKASCRLTDSAIGVAKNSFHGPI